MIGASYHHNPFVITEIYRARAVMRHPELHSDHVVRSACNTAMRSDMRSDRLLASQILRDMDQQDDAGVQWDIAATWIAAAAAGIAFWFYLPTLIAMLIRWGGTIVAGWM